MATTYVTSAEVSAAWPGFASLSADEQAALIEVASAQIDAVCRRSLAQQTYVEKHSGINTPRVWLRNRPVVAVAEVKIYDTVLDNSTDEAWTVDALTGELLRGPSWGDPRFNYWFPSGRNNVQVTYSAGYDPIPAAVKRAAILMIQALNDAGKSSDVYKSESIGDYSYSLNDGFKTVVTPIVYGLLEPYVQNEFH